jgi:DNA-directed RNA polymerase subunit N (RpoN/RPB10)
MIIPIKCFTCGEVLADKYRYFQQQVRKHKLRDGVQIDKITYLTKNNIDKTPEGVVLDDLGLNNPCCRRHMLTHVDIE